MMRTILMLTASLLTIGAVAAFAAPKVSKPTPPTKEEIAKYANAKATITTKFGTIVVRFFPDLAPLHVKQIKELAREKFYDGIVFHRVIAGFMAQTGDPTGTGMGGSKKGNLNAEFNAEPHVRGAVSMARAQSPNSADS